MFYVAVGVTLALMSTSVFEKSVSWSVVLLGVASAAFHYTRHPPYQRLDEYFIYIVGSGIGLLSVASFKPEATLIAGTLWSALWLVFALKIDDLDSFKFTPILILVCLIPFTIHAGLLNGTIAFLIFGASGLSRSIKRWWGHSLWHLLTASGIAFSINQLIN
jgi:hypothetical protein